MAQYIDKSALMLAIDKKLSYYKDLEGRGLLSKEGDAAFRAVRLLKSDIDTLEAKEVDLNNEYKDFINSDNGRSMFEVAKHFFELGLKAQKGEKV